MEALSQEAQQIFDVVDKYEDGEINLEEATKMIMDRTTLEAEAIKNILMGIERENLINFHEAKL